MPVSFPESFDALSDADLSALREAAVAEGVSLSNAETFSSTDADRLQELADGVDRIDAELTTRAAADAELAARRDALAAKFAPVEPVVEVVEAAEIVEAPLVATVPVTPAKPNARTIVAKAAAPVLPEGGNAARSIIAAAGVPGFRGGDVVKMQDLVPAMMGRFQSYKGVSHAQDLLFQLALPKLDEKLIANRQNFQQVLDYVVDESRLVNPVTGETGLIAAGGWCAPAPQDYDICILAGLDGLFDLPTMGMPRGSLSYFRHLPFNTVAAQLAAGFACYTPTELEALPPLVKPCVEIDCPEPVTAELDACSLCIRAGLLQMKAFPEYVAAWMDLAMIAYARFLNARKINEVLALLGAPIVIPGTFGAISALLSAIRLAAVDYRAANGMVADRTLEIVLPWWIYDVLNVDYERRQFKDAEDYSFADWTEDLSEIGVRAQYIKDWVGQDGGFGGAVPAINWPDSVQFMLYPAGAFVEAREDIINVSTLQDTALLTTNRVQLLFVETATKVIPACGDGRLYEVALCPSGATAGPIATTPGTYTCSVPDLVALTPNTGLPAAGGTVITLTGTNLQDTTSVTFGGTPGTNLVIVNSETIKVTTPAKAAGSYNVVVVSPFGNDTIVNGATFV